MGKPRRPDDYSLASRLRKAGESLKADGNHGSLASKAGGERFEAAERVTLPTPLDLPDLRIVPVSSLHPHEQFDANRVVPLVTRLRADGVLKNPPIVLPLGQRTERYVVLDGANRTEAFREMDLPHVLVQVAHAGDSSVRLETWNHLLRRVAVDTLLQALLAFPELALVRSDVDRATFNLSAGASLAYLAMPGDHTLEIVGETEPLRWRVANLHRIVEAYTGRCELERISAVRAAGLQNLYPDFAALMVFPRFELEDVIRAASQGVLLPAGLTRFLVSPRALRVNYPLDRLASGRSAEEKQEELEHWLRTVVASRRVRYYGEATYLFDE
ncbi:MAG: hypothetical protein MUO23_01600 [Anaerolineales bacterium]|nr:hypothetical protein [Anaerolineales bacterium]